MSGKKNIRGDKGMNKKGGSMDKLSCALKDIPKSVIEDLVNEQIKQRAMKIVNSEEMTKIVDRKLLQVLAPIVETYFEKNLNKISKIAIDQITDEFESNDLPENVFNKLMEIAGKSIMKKLNKL
jgi:hypothetical protein